MLVPFTHRLTLLAFAAHAVLGCCWHHAHVIAGDCCGPTVAVQAEEHAEDHCPHGCSGHEAPLVDSAATLPPVETSLQRLDHGIVPVCCSDSPCDHAHDCSGLHCTFVQRHSDLIDFRPALVIGAVAFVDAPRFALKAVPPPDRDFHRASQVRFTTAGQCCAALQSWQI